MVSIQPTPPSPAKRKKYTSVDEASADSPPAKSRKTHPLDTARNNEDEVDLGSDSDSGDGYGPAAPKSASRPASIGPAAPPRSNDNNVEYPKPAASSTTPKDAAGTSKTVNTDEIALDGEDEDNVAVGPAPPPKPRRVHGPAPPPADLSERPPADPEPESDSDSDDDYGPALPSSTSHQQRQARALEAAEAQASKITGPKRDEWMVAPPSAGGYRAGDPTKLKARRFNSGPRAGGSSGGGGEISSIWTETPEEKRKRLENAVLGRDSNPTTAQPSSSSHSSRPQTKEDAAQAARIQNFTEATRGRSLYEEHQATIARGDRPKGGGSGAAGAKNASKSWADEEEDDPSKRAFDREKDMKLGGRIGASQRRELVNKAADFGGRFAKGKYL
ncbi:hypothetical protein F5Y01DRAFT_285003 [Xylaria sp. FL0043]|nr:hypothetical protein F5Y01DRAFT_285003 [Xylaria sp. FL0043]